jgi:rod shape-determining protein MreC
MPLGTLDRTPPSLFKQGPSLLSQFVFFTCLSLFLMFADTRFEIAKTLRASIATVLAPVNRVLSMPGSFVNNAAIYFESQAALKESEQALKQKLLLQSQRASQVEVLGSENAHLRKLLKLQSNLATPSQAAQVLYAVSDPYARKVVIDKGSNSNIALGSPVMDAEGIIGQVVRVYPL